MSSFDIQLLLTALVSVLALVALIVSRIRMHPLLALLLISIGVAWIVEPLLGLLIGSQSWGKSIAPYFPSNATTAALDLGSASGLPGQVLSWWAGALVLLGYAAIMTAIGTALTLRRDVS